ncbi:MAG: helix-turn-helix domain-containing protein [Desulfobacteraceae bacterium]|nr:helix-turn-helix domain-containing protein [Desulfobacteraceae bacterium]MBC2754700.1 helix-turn-helix domain-containing protein [Desulfobacteraceae bacterium]
MKTQEFKNFRKKLQKTQEEMARLLGISVKAIRSYEQGWRTIPAHAERQLLFLAAKKAEILKPAKPCWTINKCNEKQKEQCPAWEFRAGSLCWFINGTICSGVVHKDWREKIEICKKCKAFPSSLKSILNSPPNVPETMSDNDCFNSSE